MPKLLFTSYAHVNRDKVLERFVQRLCHEVLQRATGQLKPTEVVFFDSEGIQTGEDWIKKLSNAVSECQVCLAICSPAFIGSEFCGKEIRVFLERLQQWEALPGNAGNVGRSIIPVIWIKSTMPDVLKRFQYDEKAFPPDYGILGLRTLCQLSKYKDKRTLVEIVLAERIVDAAKSSLPTSGAIPHFDQIDSIFHISPVGTHYGVALVPLIKGDLSAKPYGQELTLRNLMDDACGSRVPWRMLEPDGKLGQRINEAKKNREAIVVVADLDTLGQPLYKKVVAAVDAAVADQSAILLIGSGGQSTSAAQDKNLGITLVGYFPKALPKVWYSDSNSIRSLDSLRKSLEETITKLRSRLVEEDPAREATDPKMVADAAAEGVAIERQPVLTGPGGK